MPKVLVTGGTGFIGSCVVKKLLTSGYEVRCLVRKTSSKKRLCTFDLEYSVGDLSDLDSLQLACEDCEFVIHLAGISRWDLIESPQMKAVVADGTKHLLDAAVLAGVKKVIYFSSLAAMGPTLTLQCRNETALPTPQKKKKLKYVAAKQQAERYCLEAIEQGMEVVILRPAEVFGPDDDDLITAGTLVDFLKSWPVIVCRGGTSIVHVDDVAECAIKALELGKSGEVYILGGDNLHHHELARLTLNFANQNKPIVTLPAAIMRMGARCAELTRIPFPITPALVPYATGYWFVDNQKAVQELGIQFQSAQSTLEQTVNWLLETNRN